MGRYAQWAPYVSVAERSAQAAKEIAKLRKKGKILSPIVVEGRTIAHTFWGKAWCKNLESYSDYDNRLSRGRSCVRHGLVIDLNIYQGKVDALVSGSSVYQVNITILPITSEKWQSIIKNCAGEIGSLIELF
jgi:uncharacterized Zn finger protein